MLQCSTIYGAGRIIPVVLDQRKTIKNNRLVKKNTRCQYNHDLDIRKDLFMCIDQGIKKIQAEIKYRYVIQKIMEGSQTAFGVGIWVFHRHYFLMLTVEPIDY